MGKNEQFEELPTSRPGDKVLRRQRKPRGLLRTISQRITTKIKPHPHK